MITRACASGIPCVVVTAPLRSWPTFREKKFWLTVSVPASAPVTEAAPVMLPPTVIVSAELVPRIVN